MTTAQDLDGGVKGDDMPLNPDEHARLIEYANDEHEQGMREAAAFLYGRAAVARSGAVAAALIEAAMAIERLAREQREAVRVITATGGGGGG